jgi:hypothetical protein
VVPYKYERDIGDRVKGYADKAKTGDEQEEDDEGMSYVIPNFAQFSTSTTRPPLPAMRTILKRDPLEQIPLNTRRKSWKNFHLLPDLEKIGSTSTRSMTSYAESSCDDIDDISLSSKSFSVSVCCVIRHEETTRQSLAVHRLP